MSPAFFNVRTFGALGNGEAHDGAAIQAAIDAAAAAGGGTVLFPSGTFPSFTLHLRSRVAIHLEPGSRLLADYPNPEKQAGYDLPEASETGEKQYQDFGHSHFRNSLIYGEDLDSISITGFGTIDGLALVGAHHVGLPGEPPSPFQGENHGAIDDFHDYDLAETPFQGNKAIALKNCRNVTLRDFTLFRGGHFALLTTGVDNLTIDNLKVDTNRDAFDIDSCRNVRISNCSVNSPHDDAIVLKTSLALGEPRPCENVTITSCAVSGYSIGSLIDGSYDRSFKRATDNDGPTGRIKIGTESNGDFRNIAITNCTFDHCRGLALETVDGATIEDIVVSNITMRDIVTAPFFLRLGARCRGPEGTPVGKLRRVSISNVNVYDADSRYAAQVMGEPDHPIEDVSFNNIRIEYKGGTTLEQVAEQPSELVNPFFLRQEEPGVVGPRDPFAVPERPRAYPEPSMFGLLPAYGIYARHAKRIRFSDVSLRLIQADERPAIVLNDVADVEFFHCRFPEENGTALLHLASVKDLRILHCESLKDCELAHASHQTLP
ncbi:glycosyl hydrolase family 28-related protein [Pelagicoccus enzymogenes]|uniref:rhamnogalacturonidase n=1 Tax=Pelagicoccus enzymogenes TaxID=2773457 RepID=UPI00280FD582|nr:glycosyl hydrolase family 28-related protein [Pelagicoccus enzymogenes]MDQ8200776.1 glycosyl hydrolase family 28-related protein [Pelagicoccus enzymogenes]